MSSNSGLAGSLPSEMSNVAALQWLDLGSCSLNGTIPSALFALTNLTSLQLGANDFTGTLPSAISSLAFLQYVSMRCTVLRALSSEKFHRLAYRILDVSSNQLHGTVPTRYLALSFLLSINFVSNYFTGSVPASVTMQFSSAPFYDNCFTSPSRNQRSPCDDPSLEAPALVDLYSATNGPLWTVNVGWTSSVVPTCSWFGVSCSSNGRVRWGGGTVVVTLPLKLCVRVWDCCVHWVV